MNGTPEVTKSRADPEPRVTVIVTAFDRTRYLPQALGSVGAQSYPSDEIETVITTNRTTPEIVEAASRLHGKLLLVPERSQGVKIERALAESRSPIVAFLDDDDLWDPEKLTLSVGEFDHDPELGYYAHGLRIADESGATVRGGPRRVMGSYARADGLPGGKELMVSPGVHREGEIARADRFNTWNSSSIVVRRSMLEPFRAELPRVGRALDGFLLYSALMSGMRLRIDRRVLTTYRFHPENNMWIRSGSRYEQERKYARTLHEWEETGDLLVAMAEQRGASAVASVLRSHQEALRTLRRIAGLELSREEAARSLVRHMAGAYLWRRGIPWPKRIALSEAFSVVSPQLSRTLNWILERERAGN